MEASPEAEMRRQKNVLLMSTRNKGVTGTGVEAEISHRLMDALRSPRTDMRREIRAFRFKPIISMLRAAAPETMIRGAKNRRFTE